MKISEVRKNLVIIKKYLLDIGSCFLLILLMIVCILVLFFGMAAIGFVIYSIPWIVVNVNPWVNIICVVFSIIVLPISILLGSFNKTLEIGKILLWLCCYIFGLHLWFTSMILVYFNESTESLILTQIFVTTIIVYSIRAYKDAINKKVDEETNKELDEEQERINQVVEGFGKFLATERPLINDVRRLPYPKSEIYSALQKKKYELEIANLYSENGDRENLIEIEEAINSIGICVVILLGFTKIDSKDQLAVAYFNTYENEDEIPRNYQDRYMLLKYKYMFKGLEDKEMLND